MKLLSILMLMLSLMVAAYAEEEFSGSTNNVFSGELYFNDKENMKLGWDLYEDEGFPNGFIEVRAAWIDPSPNMVYFVTNVPPSCTNVVIPRIRTGHFEYGVRFGYVQNNITNYSLWASSNSTNALQSVSKTNGPWIVYWKVPKPTGVVIE